MVFHQEIMEGIDIGYEKDSRPVSDKHPKGAGVIYLKIIYFSFYICGMQ